MVLVCHKSVKVKSGERGVTQNIKEPEIGMLGISIANTRSRFTATTA